MIEKNELESLLKEYGLNISISSNDKLLALGKYEKINDTLNYLINDLKINKKNIEKCPSIILVKYQRIKDLNACGLKKENIISVAIGSNPIQDIKDMLNSDEYKRHPELFTSTTLARANPRDIKDMLNSKEYKEHPELFTSQTLAHAKLQDIKDMLNSKEYKEHPELFTSQTLARTKIQDIKDMLNSKEYKEHPELFTSTTLAYAKPQDIKDMLNSKEYKEHPELFTSQTLAYAKPQDIKDILNSEEYKEHPELFTSETLARANPQDIKDMLNSKEYEEHPELFTSQTLARTKIQDIKDMLNSKEYKEHPELFTSTTLAYAKIQDIRNLLKLPYWKKEKYKKLLTCSIVANSKKMISKLPIQIQMAEEYKISNYITTSFLRSAPSQNYAKINYLIDNNLSLTIDEKLNPIFSYSPSCLKKMFNIDIKMLIAQYPFDNYENKVKVVSLNEYRRNGH